MHRTSLALSLETFPPQGSAVWLGGSLLCSFLLVAIRSTGGDRKRGPGVGWRGDQGGDAIRRGRSPKVGHRPLCGEDGGGVPGGRLRPRRVPCVHVVSMD